jgi:glycosyltransferase involved in cell wall biosynthesis
MPSLLVNASALALARPNNIQAQGGFPTKLGEYLATGNPVVVTSVGEIPNYLKHLENSYIAQPNNPDDFAEKLTLLFSDSSQAQSIGLRGKELAMGIFNYKTQSSSIFKIMYG